MTRIIRYPCHNNSKVAINEDSNGYFENVVLGEKYHPAYTSIGSTEILML